MPKTAEKTEIGVIIEDKGSKTDVFREAYPIKEPYVYAAIIKDPETQKMLYKIIEPTLQKDEEERLKEIKKLLMEEIDVSLNEIGTREKAESYLKQKTTEIIKKYRIKIPPESIDKL